MKLGYKENQGLFVNPLRGQIEHGQTVGTEALLRVWTPCLWSTDLIMPPRKIVEVVEPKFLTTTNLIFTNLKGLAGQEAGVVV